MPAHLDLPAFSSSSSGQDASIAPDRLFAANASDRFNLPNAQYGRRRYGRPRYRGSNTNADGSEKYTFFAGAGFTQPLGNTYHYQTPSWGVEVGGGRNFDKTFGMMVQFDWDNFGLTGRTLALQQALYNQIITYYNAGAQGNQQASLLSSLDGHTHVWSFTLDPVVNLTTNQEGLGAYLVAGVGFYHKVTNFTVPTVGTYYDPYYGYYQAQSNQSIDQYTSNAPGFNGGFGLTYKFSHFSNERFFAEARYVYLLNQQRQGVTAYTVTAANASAYNDFPANSNRTSYLPVKVGIRF